MKTRNIGIFTSSRSEYSSFRGLLRKISEDDFLNYSLIVSGAHLLDTENASLSEITDDKFEISAEIKMFSEVPSSEEFSAGLGVELSSLVQVLPELDLDILLINGDRVELLPLVTAALVLKIPVAHIAGGELTGGAIDDSVRHAVTKLSHIHFPTNALHAKRLKQMGEKEERIFVTGEPALDEIQNLNYLSKRELSDSLNITLEGTVVLVTFHPETLSINGGNDIDCLIDVMASFEATYVITYPNVDPGSELILKKLEAFCKTTQNTVLIESLGQLRYYSMLNLATLMLGNSSSGLWEAPSFELPVVNLGLRQEGRLRSMNVIDVPTIEKNKILRALERAASSEFKEKLRHMVNPYGTGSAVDKMLKVLRSIDIGPSLLKKGFCDG